MLAAHHGLAEGGAQLRAVADRRGGHVQGEKVWADDARAGVGAGHKRRLVGAVRVDVQQVPAQGRTHRELGAITTIDSSSHDHGIGPQRRVCSLRAVHSALASVTGQCAPAVQAMMALVRRGLPLIRRLEAILGFCQPRSEPLWRPSPPGGHFVICRVRSMECFAYGIGAARPRPHLVLPARQSEDMGVRRRPYKHAS